MNNKNRVLTVMLIALIVGMTAGYALALNPSFQTIIQPGSSVSTVSEIAFTDGSSSLGNYFLKNGRTGEIESSSTNAATILQIGIDIVVNHQGTLIIRNGTWDIGTTNLTITKPNALGFSIEWEMGTNIAYSGMGPALDIYTNPATPIHDFSLINPRITTITGSCLHIFGVNTFDIFRPTFLCAVYGIDISRSNTGRIIDGGSIIEYGNIRGAGTVGIRLGNADIVGSAVNEIDISPDTIKNFYYGVTIGWSNYVSNQPLISIKNTFISSNVVGIQIFSGRTTVIENDYFEAQTAASIQVTNPASHSPDNLIIQNNFFTESVINLNIPDNNDLYGLYAPYNSWSGALTIGNKVYFGTVDITNAGTVTMTSTRVHLTFSPNPQTGVITGISTTNAGNVTGSVTYPAAFPSGLSYKVFVTLSGPSATTSVQTAWVWGRTNVGFSWTVWIITNVAGTVSLEWQSSL